MRFLCSKFVLVMVLVLLMTIFCACNNQTNNSNIENHEDNTTKTENENDISKKIFSMVNDEVNADAVITKTYSPEVLLNMPYQVHEIFEKIPPECVRLSEDSKYAYFVYKSDDGHYAFCFYSFEYNDIEPFSQFYFGQSVTLLDFDNFKIGETTIEDVKSLDPYGEYGMFELGMVNIEKFTTHYTSDGYKVEVFFDKNGVLSKIQKKKISEMTYEQDGLLALLLEKDKEMLISNT